MAPGLKILKFVGWTVVALPLLLLVAYWVVVGINLRDQPPSATALQFDSVIESRPPVPDAENGFVYLLGLEAPESDDVASLGTTRARWLEKTEGVDSKSPDPLPRPIDFTKGRSATVVNLLNSCKPDDLASCPNALQAAVDAQTFTAIEALQLARYRTWLSHPRWREQALTRAASPLPPFSHLLAGQKLGFLDLAREAKRGDATAVHDGLERDLVTWRGVYAKSNLLISRMIALAAIRAHFYYGNLVLRALPPASEARAVPASWRAPFTAAEISMLNSMSGELRFSQGVLRDWSNGTLGRETADLMFDEGSVSGLQWRLAARWSYALLRPLFQEQDSANQIADRYMNLVASFDVPLEKYIEAAESYRAGNHAAKFPRRAYNFTGDLLLSLMVQGAYTEYPLRCASVEGGRRAALAVSDLRTREVPRAQAARSLAESAWRNPYTNAPFAWDVAEEAVVFEGLENTRRRQAFAY
jgi:hypothetical protein